MNDDLEGSSHDMINHYPSICLEKLKKTMYKSFRVDSDTAACHVSVIS